MTGKSGKPSVVLEAVAGWDTWIWHASFGEPGSNNDINIIDRSPLISAILKGEFPQFSFTVNGKVYKRVYFLADGIYPTWSIFVVKHLHSN